MKLRLNLKPLVLAVLFVFLSLLSLHGTTGQLFAQAPGTTPPETIPSGTIVLTPIKDNTLYENEDKSNGAGAYLFVGSTSAGNVRRALLKFDLTQVPSGTTILSATLKLVLNQTSSGPNPVSLHKALADWGEGASNASGEEGSGTAAQTNDATWKHTFFDTTLWSKPGGDFVAKDSGFIFVGGLGDYVWNTPEMAVDAQIWCASPFANFGWIVVGDENDTRTAKRFASRENSQANERPQLTLVYGPATGNEPTCNPIAKPPVKSVYLPIVQK